MGAIFPELSGLQTALITAAAMGVACAVLSVFVVLRRWAFIGEGIAHAGFGGAGTAWLLALIFPSVAFFQAQWGIYAVAVVFSIGVAVAIAWVTRREGVHADTAIGISLVASLAWGFVAYGIYSGAHSGQPPPDWDHYVLGQMRLLHPAFAVGAVLICAGVVVMAGLLGKEIMAYCFDPVLAEVSGVRVAFIHYLLTVLVAVTIVLGMRMMGSLLVVALLVLPGATALLLSRDVKKVIGAAVAIGLIGALAGPLVSERWPFVPEGPAIVLVLVVEFAFAYAWRRVRSVVR